MIRDIMVFRHSHGGSTSWAVQKYKTYDEQSVERDRGNPYTLFKNIHGRGFKTDDQIAQNVGIPMDSLVGACTGLNHVLVGRPAKATAPCRIDYLNEDVGKLPL